MDNLPAVETERTKWPRTGKLMKNDQATIASPRVVADTMVFIGRRCRRRSSPSRPSLRLCSGAAPAGLLEILCPHCFNTEKRKSWCAQLAPTARRGNYNGAKTRRCCSRRYLANVQSGRARAARILRISVRRFPHSWLAIIVLWIKIWTRSSNSKWNLYTHETDQASLKATTMRTGCGIVTSSSCDDDVTDGIPVSRGLLLSFDSVISVSKLQHSLRSGGVTEIWK